MSLGGVGIVVVGIQNVSVPNINNTTKFYSFSYQLFIGNSFTTEKSIFAIANR